MSRLRSGTCGEPGPRDAHCTLHRMHEWSCYDGGEDVSWNEGQWYHFDLAPHDCGDDVCPARGYRGPAGRESEYVDDLDPASLFLPGVTAVKAVAAVDHVLTQLLPAEVPVFRYEGADPAYDPAVETWRRVAEAGALTMHRLPEGEWLLVAHELAAICDQDPDEHGDQA